MAKLIRHLRLPVLLAVLAAASSAGVEKIAIPLGEGTPPIQISLLRLMEIFNTPGLSFAVIDNFKIVQSAGVGVTENGGTKPVTPKTLFLAGSISKSVAAAATLHLVDAGKLSLDEDVNKKLVSWKVPDNEFTKDRKVTLRRIMSHSAGLGVHGFRGYEIGQPIPTLVQVLNGEKPANSPPVRVIVVPGTKYEYSGGGITIEQLLDIEVTGKPFPEFVRETVFDKIGMADSTFEQPLPAARAALAAAGTANTGKPVPGKWFIYPEMAAAGLWTTPTDLAKFAIEIALSKQGKANRVLSQRMTQEMLTSQIDDVGLGFFLGGKHNPSQFGHDGVDMGFEATLVMFSDTGRGVAVMGNSNNLGRVAPYLVDAISKEYGWDRVPEGLAAGSLVKYTPVKFQGGNLLVIVEAERGTQAAIDTYNYVKNERPPGTNFEKLMLSQLSGALLRKNKIEDAIRVLKLSVQDDPGFWHGYDALAGAYARAGQTQLAIDNYQKALDLNPKNQEPAEKIRKLKEQK